MVGCGCRGWDGAWVVMNGGEPTVEDGTGIGMVIFWRAIGGNRTTGFPASVTAPGGRGNALVAGERMPFCEAPPTSDDLRLMAMLGEYVLPPYTLVLRLPV